MTEYVTINLITLLLPDVKLDVVNPPSTAAPGYLLRAHCEEKSQPLRLSQSYMRGAAAPLVRIQCGTAGS